MKIKIVNGTLMSFGDEKDLVFPKSMTAIDMDKCHDDFLFHADIESIRVEEGNPVFHSESNCLINAETKELVFGCINSIIPDDGSVTSIGMHAFEGVGNPEYCDSKYKIKNIIIPKSIKEIKQRAFAFSGIEEIDLHEGIEFIGGLAFMSSNIKEVHIPNSAKLCPGVFCACDNLKSIFVNADNPYYECKDNCLYTKSSHIMFACCNNPIIPDGIEITEKLTFYGLCSSTMVTFPASVKEIRRNGFDMPVCIEFPNFSSGEDVLNTSIATFLAPKGSYAIEFAKENGIPYKEI